MNRTVAGPDDGVCSVCGREILAGQVIVFDGQAEWAHDSCWPETSWLMQEFKRARERSAQLPLWARPVIRANKHGISR